MTTFRSGFCRPKTQRFGGRLTLMSLSIQRVNITSVVSLPSVRSRMGFTPRAAYGSACVRGRAPPFNGFDSRWSAMMRFSSWLMITRESRFPEQFSGRIHHIQSLAFNQKCYSGHWLCCLRTSTFSIRPCHGLWFSLTRTTARDRFVLQLASRHNPN